MDRSDDDKYSEDQPAKHDHVASNSDLMSSAKLVAEAAQHAARNESDKVDKERVAGAAADLLEAASKYGKLDESSGIGKYVGQAEDYLDKYGHSKGSAGHPVEGTEPAGHSPSEESETHAPKKEQRSESKEVEDEGGSKYGGYLKMAQGFLK